VVGPQQSNLTLAGNPPLMDSETWGTIRDSTHIDWTATLSGGLTPDYTTFQVGDTAYPLQLVSGNLTISSAASGTGLLIVGGNLTVSSELVFSGIVLVGGGIEFEADTARIAGMVIAGLNGGGGPKVRVGGSADQGITVVYNSCAVSRAMVPLAGLAPLRNAWLDTWATY
jgi:hypothetical protein